MANSAFDEQVLALRERMSTAGIAIFVARLSEGRKPVLELGTLERQITPAMRNEVQQRLSEIKLRPSVRFVRHDATRLRKVRSLEALIARTGSGALVFDRTKSLQRSEAIVKLSGLLRAKLGESVSGVFFQSERRTLFVILSAASRTSASELVERSRITDAIIEVEQAWRGAQEDSFEISVRVGFDVPAGLEVIAVDRQTVRATFLQMLRRPLKGSLAAAVVGSLAGTAVTVPVMAADLVLDAPIADAQSEPAVDEANFSVSTLGGVARDPVLFNHLWAGLNAKGAIPLGERFGAQVDLGIATDSYYGAALHLFARDPAMGLVGLVGSAESKYGVSMNRIGVELEYYINDSFTVAARAGYQGGVAPNGAFGRVDVKFYPDPNFAITGGLEAQPSSVMARGGFEWRPAADTLPGLSVSADADVASNGNYRAMFGLHFQIGGGGTSLLDRDRRSDPSSAIWNEIDVSSAVPKGYAGPL